MTASEILERIPEPERAGGRRHLPGPLVHLRSPRSPSHRAKPASRESPWSRRVTTPGAGGTVANNLAALGVQRVAVLGADRRRWLRLGTAAALDGARHRHRSLREFAAPSQTFTYTKLLNAATGDEDLPRVDFINPPPLPAGGRSQLSSTTCSCSLALSTSSWSPTRRRPNTAGW